MKRITICNKKIAGAPNSPKAQKPKVIYFLNF